MKGMVVFDYAKNYPTATKEMTQWILDGTLKSKEIFTKELKIFMSF